MVSTPPQRPGNLCPSCNAAMLKHPVEYECPRCGHVVARPRAAAALRRRRRNEVLVTSAILLAGLCLLSFLLWAYVHRAPEDGILSANIVVRSHATARTFVPVECVGDGRLAVAPFHGVGLLTAPPYHTVLIVGRRIRPVGVFGLPSPQEPYVEVWDRSQQGSRWTKTILEAADCRMFEVRLDIDRQRTEYRGALQIDCAEQGLSVQARAEFARCRRDAAFGVRTLD